MARPARRTAGQRGAQDDATSRIPANRQGKAAAARGRDPARMKRLVLFDVDGTLLDSQHMIVAGMTQAFAACGLAPPPRAAMLAGVGLSLPVLFNRLAGPHAPLAALTDAYKAAWKALRQVPDFSYPLFPGADALLRRLAARHDIVCGIATGKSRNGVADMCSRCGWQGLFATIQTADDAPSKPSPVMIEQALRQTGFAARDCVMIGDTSFDMDMARAAGAQALGVAWGYHSAEALRAAGAQHIAADFAALAEALA